MSAHYLGQPFDIHGGGSDLVFPHHENEIAQSEAAADVPLADLWVHNGMITFGTDKMSKSLGNVIGIAEATRRAPGEALRLLFFRTHYRAPLDFGPGRLEEESRSLERLYESLARADEAAGAAIAERNEARRRKDFPAADAIRDRLLAQGVLLEDTPSGTVWKPAE